MNHDDRNKKGGARRSRALVLGAGGPVGRTWQSGLIAGLIEREIDLGDASLIIGTSAGAIVGAQLALGLKFAAPSKFDFAGQPASASLSDVSGLLAAMARAMRSPEPEIERAKIGAFAIEAQTISEEDSIARTAFAQIRGHSWPTRFRATAVNARTGKLQVWDASSGATLERAVASSAAIPGVFPPVEIDSDLLMDGAIAANTPLRLAVQFGASRIIILPTGYACALKDPPTRAVGKILHAITLMIAWQLMRELELIPESVDVHLVPTLCPLAVSPFDFSASHELIERAAESSKKWIEEGGLTRRALRKSLRLIVIEFLRRHRTGGPTPTSRGTPRRTRPRNCVPLWNEAACRAF